MKHSRLNGTYPLPSSKIEEITADGGHYSGRVGGHYEILPKGVQRVLNCTLSLLGIIVTFPLMVMIFVALRVECRESALVARVVRPHMKPPVTVLRFRTRRAGSARELTKVGQFLADTGLDRLPSLFSVFNGDLSFFGNASSLPGSFGQFRTSKSEVPFSIYANVLKRPIDVVLVVLASPMILIVVGTLYLVVRADGGSGFFGQRRVGRHGKEFFCWKIRSMQVNAAQMLEEHLQSNPDAAKEWEETRKLADDPRITKIGKILRKTSLDEFPQFWNVLRGDMSIVGPRPVPSDELQKYDEKDVFYKAVRPGITGLWQVSGRNEISYEERVSLDQTYTTSISFLGDMKIILKTIDSMLKRTGG